MDEMDEMDEVNTIVPAQCFPLSKYVVILQLLAKKAN